MSQAFKIIVKKLEEKGIEGGELVAAKVFEALEEAMPAIVVDAETSSIEKTLAGVLAPVIGGLKPAFQKATDFDKDGQVG